MVWIVTVRSTPTSGPDSWARGTRHRGNFEAGSGGWRWPWPLGGSRGLLVGRPTETAPPPLNPPPAPTINGLGPPAQVPAELPPPPSPSSPMPFEGIAPR